MEFHNGVGKGGEACDIWRKGYKVDDSETEKRRKQTHASQSVPEASTVRVEVETDTTDVKLMQLPYG